MLSLTERFKLFWYKYSILTTNYEDIVVKYGENYFRALAIVFYFYKS